MKRSQFFIKFYLDLRIFFFNFFFSFRCSSHFKFLILFVFKISFFLTCFFSLLNSVHLTYNLLLILVLLLKIFFSIWSFQIFMVIYLLVSTQCFLKHTVKTIYQIRISHFHFQVLLFFFYKAAISYWLIFIKILMASKQAIFTYRFPSC